MVLTPPPLSARLRGVFDLVPAGTKRVADIGAGHGALSVHLRTAVKVVIATEAADGPYTELQRNLARWGALDQVETRRGSGLDPIAPDEVECAVIAGMGAHRALSIVDDAAGRGVRTLVMQCMQHAHLVEPWVVARGWRVVARAAPIDHGRAYPSVLVEVVR